MECESVRVVINQEYEFSGTLIYYENRVFWGTLPDLTLSQKADAAALAVLDDGFVDTCVGYKSCCEIHFEINRN